MNYHFRVALHYSASYNVSNKLFRKFILTAVMEDENYIICKAFITSATGDGPQTLRV